MYSNNHDYVFGNLIHDPTKNFISADVRSEFFKAAIRFIDYELIEGDIFEFGVYSGRSLALLSYFHELSKRSIHKINFTRNIVGFDSFEGLPETDGHPRWKKNLFNVNHSSHPLSKLGDKITDQTVYELFKLFSLQSPILQIGTFDKTVTHDNMAKFNKAALIHIDCDIYQSTKTVLDGIVNHLQEGTLLLFDDWFHFKGNKDKGEQKAFFEFMATSQWDFIEYQTYATFGKSFITTYK